MDLNHNLSECMRTQMNWGENVIHNVCAGTTAIVPWGAVDWAIATGVAGLMAVMLAMLAGMVLMLFDLHY